MRRVIPLTNDILLKLFYCQFPINFLFVFRFLPGELYVVDVGGCYTFDMH